MVGQEPYDPNHVILPEIMKDNGYTTGMFGKWAGGYEGSVSTPDRRGIDEFFGYICQYQAHLYYPNFLNRFSKQAGDSAVRRIVLEKNIKHSMFGDDYFNRTQYSADIIHREAMRWIERQTPGKPFFGLLTYTLPHAELAQPHDSIYNHYKQKFFIDRTWGGNEGSRYNPADHTHAHFAAMITRLDTYVGEIVALLNLKNLYENTIIVFKRQRPSRGRRRRPQIFRARRQAARTQAAMPGGRHSRAIHSVLARTHATRQRQPPPTGFLRRDAHIVRHHRREKLRQTLRPQR